MKKQTNPSLEENLAEVCRASDKWTRDIGMFGVTELVLRGTVANATNEELIRGTGVTKLVIRLLTKAQGLVALAADGRPEYGVDAEQMINRAKYIIGEYLTDA